MQRLEFNNIFVSSRCNTARDAKDFFLRLLSLFNDNVSFEGRSLRVSMFLFSLSVRSCFEYGGKLLVF